MKRKICVMIASVVILFLVFSMLAGCGGSSRLTNGTYEIDGSNGPLNAEFTVKGGNIDTGGHRLGYKIEDDKIIITMKDRGEYSFSFEKIDNKTYSISGTEYVRKN